MVRRRPLVVLSVLLPALVLGLGATAPAGVSTAAVPGSIELLVGEGTDWAFGANISPDGRYVVFHTRQKLVSSDTNDLHDVYLLDRTTGDLELVSRTPGGGSGNGSSGWADVSADGRFVAFASAASTLIPGDESAQCYPAGITVTAGETARYPCFQVYLLDRETEIIQKLHDTSEEGLAQFAPAISGDGSVVVFETYRPAVPTGGLVLHTHRQSLTIVDRTTGQVEQVHVGPTPPAVGDQAGIPERNIDPLNPDISHDGNSIVFSSEAPPVLEGAPSPEAPPYERHLVYLYDRAEDRLRVISDPPHGGANDTAFPPPKISADGNRVAFVSWASNLVPADVESSPDVFLWERGRLDLSRVSVTSFGGGAGRGVAWDHGGRAGIGISPDGRRISFTSPSSLDGERSDCPGRPGLPCLSVFIHDLEDRSTEQVLLPGGGDPDRDTWDLAMSAGSEHLLFSSNARNILPNGEESPPGYSLYLLHRGRELGAHDLEVDHQGQTLHVAGLTRWRGVAAASVDDPDDDGLGSPVLRGTELTGGEVVFRPTREDLAVVWKLRDAISFPVNPNSSFEHGMHTPVPLLRVTFDFKVGGRTYRVQGLQDAWRQPEDVDQLTEGWRFELMDCSTGSCVRVTDVDGALGSTGVEAIIALPLATLDASPGATISDAVLTTQVAGTVVDEVPLGTFDIPAAHGSVALRSAGSSVPVATALIEVLGGGRFEAILDVNGIRGEHVLDIELCVGTTCRVEEYPIDLDD